MAVGEGVLPRPMWSARVSTATSLGDIGRLFASLEIPMLMSVVASAAGWKGDASIIHGPGDGGKGPWLDAAPIPAGPR
jgi:hypothetical protein